MSNLADPYEHVEAATPSNTIDEANVSTGIYLDVAGTLSIETGGGDDITFANLAAGVWHQMRVKRVNVTGTTATGIKLGR